MDTNIQIKLVATSSQTPLQKGIYIAINNYNIITSLHCDSYLSYMKIFADDVAIYSYSVDSLSECIELAFQHDLNLEFHLLPIKQNLLCHHM